MEHDEALYHIPPKRGGRRFVGHTYFPKVSCDSDGLGSFILHQPLGFLRVVVLIQVYDGRRGAYMYESDMTSAPR